MEKYQILGINITNITTQGLVSYVKEAITSSDGPRLIFTPNPEIIYRATREKPLSEVLNSSSVNLPDGIGILIASRVNNYPIYERVTGIDACLNLCSSNLGPVFFLGSSPGVVDDAVNNLRLMYPEIEIAGYHHGYFKDEDDERIIALVNDSGAKILFVGMGAPRQEYWLAKHKDKLKIKVAMVIGGTMDVVSGSKKRAPAIFQKLYLEWLFRLMQEPLRFKRMLVLPLFVLRVVKNKL